jgi:hypothetical protein
MGGIQFGDIANGLFYLHTTCLSPVYHGDLKGVSASAVTHYLN